LLLDAEEDGGIDVAARRFAVAEGQSKREELDFGFFDILGEAVGGAFGIDADFRAEVVVGQIVKAVEDALAHLFDDIGYGDSRACVAEVCATFISGPGVIEGSVMGDNLEGDHVKLMESFHEDMEDVVVSFFSKSFSEVGEGSLGGDMVGEACRLSISVSAIVPQHFEEGAHIGEVVNDADEIEDEQRYRVIAGRAEDAVGIGSQRADERKVNQGDDHGGVPALNIAVGKDVYGTLLEDIMGQPFWFGEKFVVVGGNLFVDSSECFGYVLNGKFVKWVHVYLRSGRGLQPLPGSTNEKNHFPVSFSLKSFLNG